MPFHPRLDEEAAKALIAMPPDLRQHVVSEIRRLAESPATLSRPTSFPHPLDGQLFDVRYSGADQDYFITIMFRYASDEAHIDIVWIVSNSRSR